VCSEESSQPKRAKVDVETPTENTEPGASLVGISERLAEFLGTTEREMTQTEASRRVWEYIKLKQLEVGNECRYPSLSPCTFHISSLINFLEWNFCFG